MKRSIKRAASLLALILIGAVLFDVVAFLALRDLVQRLAPEYGAEPEAVRVAAEAGFDASEFRYFRASPTRGFDIIPGARAVTDLQEAEPFEVWANSLGCFDDEPPHRVAPDIYLAGDSFTWGFAPYETKFGTILERRKDLLVYACGVPHTGQRHQFEKFLEVAESFPGWPRLVIVSVYVNDIANDFFFPHTTAVDGKMVEDTLWKMGPHGPIIHRIKDPQPAKGNQRIATRIEWKYYLKKYSATAVILAKLRREIFGSRREYRSIYELYEHGTYPIDEEFAAPNRRAMSNWLDHARRNGYKIRFSLIPARELFGANSYSRLKKYLRKIGAVVWDFEEYMLMNGLKAEDLYWSEDPHFNPEGNAAYLRFLIERLERDTSGGALIR